MAIRTFIPHSGHTNSGFTLVELLVVVAIAAILAQSAFPGMTNLMKDSRNAMKINELHASLALGRSEAIKHQTSVVLCKSASGKFCEDFGSDWHNGWIVFIDSNGNNVIDRDAGEHVLRFFVDDMKGLTLNFASPRLAYDATGIATQGTGNTYVLCDDRGPAHAKALVVNAIGRLRLARDTNGNGIVEDALGNDITCS